MVIINISYNPGEALALYTVPVKALVLHSKA